MTDLAPSIDEYARATALAVTIADLRTKFGASAAKRAVARKTFVRLLPGVYAPAVHADAFAVRAHAASLWARAPISGIAALYLWGLVDHAPKTIEVMLPQARKIHAPDWIRVRRVTSVVPLSMRAGISVVSPAAAVVLGYGNVRQDQRAEVVYRAVRQRLASPRQIQIVLDSLPRVKARASLATRVRAAAAGAQSFLEEHALYRVFNTREFAGFVRQHEVVIEGNQFFLDMFDPVTKTALELDGRDGHTGAGRQRNVARDCWVATVGILTLRFTYADLMDRPEWCRQIVRAALEARKALQEAAKARNRT